MKTLVCFKAIPDFDMLSGQDWEMGETRSPDLRFVKRGFNCFDESGLEMALRLRDQAKKTDDPLDLTALTIDDQKGDLFLTHLLSVGYGSAVRINTDMDLRFNALSVSCLISAYIKRNQQQLVILGTQGGEGDNRQTGMLVAEQLGWPCIREVTDILYDTASKNLTVTSRTEGGVVVQTITPPIVLVIGNSSASPFLRVPTLKQKLGSRDKIIQVLTPGDLGVTAKMIETRDKTLIDLWQEKSGRTCVFIDGSSAKEKAQRLFDLYLKKALIK